jgi:hydrogenase expression/formation protein HypE
MEDKILLSHGNGGKKMEELLDQVIVKTLNKTNKMVQMDDSALIRLPGDNCVFTTDSYTVSPIFFKGGNIGHLAVNGTVNDIAVMGAEPKFLSCGLIIEEGLEVDKLTVILNSMREAAEKAGVTIVTGDTKVVENGKADKIFINTAGIGIIHQKVARLPVQPGDKIIINGSIGDHGIAIMAQRNDLFTEGGLKSDCAPLNHLIKKILTGYRDSVKFIRDATRGGVVSVLREIIKHQDFSIKLIEDSLPFKQEVLGVCDLLGIDPLYAANEGKFILIAAKKDADKIVKLMQENEFGNEAAIIGEITAEFNNKVFLETALGGTRILPQAIESQLPRIC